MTKKLPLLIGLGKRKPNVKNDVIAIIFVVAPIALLVMVLALVLYFLQYQQAVPVVLYY